MRTLKKFQQITEIVSNQFINCAPHKELQRALKSSLYWKHNTVKLNAKKEVLQKELIRINKLLILAQQEENADTADIKQAIADYLKVDRELIAYAIDCPVSQNYDVDLKDGRKYEVTYKELEQAEQKGEEISTDKEAHTEITQEKKQPQSNSYKKRVTKKSPKEKIAWVQGVAIKVEKSSIKETALKLGKSVTYIVRTYRAYTEVYLKSTLVANAFDAKKIGWSKLHKLAEKKITPERLEEFANSI